MAILSSPFESAGPPPDASIKVAFPPTVNSKFSASGAKIRNDFAPIV